MCGIVGSLGIVQDDARLLDSLELMRHRGPDFQSEVKIDKCHLGHVRLSIVDLFPTGSQPMFSSDKNLVIVFNGEIYNHKELRRQIETDFDFNSFIGSSDTEVLLACIQFYGIEQALTRLNGMFAFALYDVKKKYLYLVRDRVGEKPLYYFEDNALNNIYFASDVQALRKLFNRELSLSSDSITSYFINGYIDNGLSIYNNVYQLEPGTFIKYHLDENEKLQSEKKKYWNIQNYGNALFAGSFEEAQYVLDTLLDKSITEKLYADVPVGVFLSGGIDSSLIAAKASEIQAGLFAFSVVFDDKRIDESKIASSTAAALGLNHVVFNFNSSRALELVDYISIAFSEPFADISMLPTMYLCKETKKYTTVVLSGDGADELFGGYRPYDFIPKIMKVKDYMNKFGVESLPDFIGQFIPKKLFFALKGQDDYQIRQFLESPLLIDSFLVDNLNIEERFIKKSYKINTTQESLMYLDFIKYLPYDILVKLDRSAMGFSIESRIPFLDHRIIEFSKSLPLNFKIRNGSQKVILKELLSRKVRNFPLDLRKKGFVMPIAAWLRNELREWSNDLIFAEKSNYYRYVSYTKVVELWKKHLSGKDNSKQLWTILMFFNWYRNYHE